MIQNPVNASAFPDIGHAQVQSNVLVGIDPCFSEYMFMALRCSGTRFLSSKSHHTLLRPPLLIRLFTGSLPPTNVEQRISDNSPIDIWTTPRVKFVLSAQKKASREGIKR